MAEYELNFSSCLFKRMYESHMTQSALSDISGIPRPTIYRYINDEGRMPNIEYAYKIARALGMTLDELVKEWNDISDEELFGLEKLGSEED